MNNVFNVFLTYLKICTKKLSLLKRLFTVFIRFLSFFAVSYITFLFKKELIYIFCLVWEVLSIVFKNLFSLKNKYAHSRQLRKYRKNINKKVPNPTIQIDKINSGSCLIFSHKYILTKLELYCKCNFISTLFHVTLHYKHFPYGRNCNLFTLSHILSFRLIAIWLSK